MLNRTTARRLAHAALFAFTQGATTALGAALTTYCLTHL